jgi:2-polyprenyl-3-methyl-5-hydroxy-6-metoxy-1,4-benzoquinol methylase
MADKQQKQTKKFFEDHAKIWHKHSISKSSNSVNVVKMRNQYVEKICSKFLKKKMKTLDVACGVGDLVISLLQKKYDSFGVDFSYAMIKQAKFDAKKLNLSSDRFFTSSIFDFEQNSKFNLISANGFIEYISKTQLIDFIKKSYTLLEKDGIFILESRNRLFNVFSFNNYTKAEIKLKQINYLLDECILFNTSKNLKELLKKKYISKLTKNIQQHEITGNEFTKINVDKRYQYTPFELIMMLKKSGFEIIDIMPYHIHGITTGGKEIKPKIQTHLAYYLQEQENLLLKLVPQSSSFMISARKK